jgi:hypothetical protein
MVLDYVLKLEKVVQDKVHAAIRSAESS